jgi:hypothetical protein
MELNQVVGNDTQITSRYSSVSRSQPAYSTAMKMESGYFFTFNSQLKVTEDKTCHFASNRLLKKITCCSAVVCMYMRKIQYVDETKQLRL